ncbi:universal stress protein [Desulforamulus putei]|uniref:Universal stress protein family protein n=1 Tax=Desulforamulus putei DSM 12395 TaxID=1121429 RepID=A0A1M4WTJ4_9FIRM|nr:universal stress protein [Desulforamulus putei]SHE84556.1 Universal stress protein family protein [Desulforamulus putei DSM 12395]
MNGQILFITDGSPSADAAGETAIRLAREMKMPLKAVFILDEGWKYLLGDEWINTSSTRMKFFHWFEYELKNHAETVLNEFAKKAKDQNVKVEVGIKIGKTEKVITKLTVEKPTTFLILPNPHATTPAAAAGLRFNLNRLAKKVTCQIILGPGQ